MINYKLSVIIPSLNEEWLGKTIQDVIEHSNEDTEIIAVLDGWEPDFRLPKSERLKVIRNEITKGQRAAQNIGVKESTSDFVMKCDSHISLSQGFDKVMIEIMEANPDIVLVPALGNLHVYDYICPKGHRTYQGKVDKCSQCDSKELTKELVWKVSSKLYSDFYFDKDLIFQFGDVDNFEMLHETKAIQGSCFIVSRDNYWIWELCDELWGSWGQQGYEVYTKTIRNGGKVFSTRRAFMGHFFRKADEFPYKRSQEQIDNSYKKSLELSKIK